MRAKSLLLFSCALSIGGPLAGQAGAFPISPLTLWELIQRSELIVLARTDEVTRPEVEAPADGEEVPGLRAHVARLGVVEVWKGAAPAEIHVEFYGDFICPAPAHYEEGAMVLAFLRRPYEEERLDDASREWPDDDAAWQTVGLSYGTLYPEPGEIPVLRDRVDGALELTATGSAPELLKRDWLVRSAARRATRWHGLYELAASGDAMHSFYDASGRPAQASPRRLPELEAVLEGFLAEPSADVTLPMTLKYLRGLPSPELDQTVLGLIEGLLLEQRLPYWIPTAMAAALERLGVREPRERLALGEYDFDVDHDVLRLAWGRVFDELSRERQRPLRLPEREYRPVGSRTPS